MSDAQLASIAADWSEADPATLTAGHAARLAELRQLDGALAALYERGAAVLAGAPDANALRERHTALLGRERGIVTQALGGLPGLPPEQRRTRGRGLNLVKRWLGEVHDARRDALERERESAGALDVTLPGRRPWTGRPHVLAQVRDDLLDLFHGLGFSVYTSPEVELDEYNFGKLNFAPDHPARDAHDTYFVSPDVVLRTHTSPGWVRAMEERKPPLRLVFPGRVYRAEATDASHMDQFHQIDGLFVDRNVSMADLKATLNTFARAIYRADLPTRIVPIYFPFVEPGMQMDVQCVRCAGSGHTTDAEGEKRCPVCKGTKWVEVLGAGMVHPNVFRAVGLDPEQWTGFAFGMGLERIAMGRHGIPEIRLFLENDVRFLRQF
ncbi:MAG: phenylalanine--tRNA ligase subunit alpha [Candidatus Eisenbacteria bacterium]|nr:phenylalanine--tRNA ligase subunit alpha [Candidatus Eisenbacteria bacterium]